MKSLIVGMGIGELYKKVLTDLGHTVFTVDLNPEKNSDYISVDQAIQDHNHFDTVNICTPNFSHKQITEKVAMYSKIVFIEKPGLKNSQEWVSLIKKYPNTRFMMVKNNMWRNNIDELKNLVTVSSRIEINWLRENCIPSPGSWFTNKDFAFGGASRDLMPHLLSIFISLNHNWNDTVKTFTESKQMWQLKDINSTEYGTIYSNGVYNVDDFCSICYENRWILQACWRNLQENKSEINFYQGNTLIKTEPLGWCPEYAYCNMIKDAISNINCDKFWSNQFQQDVWIHNQVECL